MTPGDFVLVSFSSAMGFVAVCARQIWLMKNRIYDIVALNPAASSNSVLSRQEVDDWVVSFTGNLGPRGAKLLPVPIYSPSLAAKYVRDAEIDVSNQRAIGAELSRRVEGMIGYGDGLVSFLVQFDKVLLRRVDWEFLDLLIRVDVVDSTLVTYRDLTFSRKVKSVPNLLANRETQVESSREILKVDEVVNDLCVCLCFVSRGGELLFHNRPRNHSTRRGASRSKYVLTPALFDAVRLAKEEVRFGERMSLSNLIRASVFRSCDADPSVSKTYNTRLIPDDLGLLRNSISKDASSLTVLGFMSNIKQASAVLYVACLVDGDDIRGRSDLRSIESVLDADVQLAASAKALIFLANEHSCIKPSGSPGPQVS